MIAAYAPDLIIVSAGYDAVVGDPLGGMNLSPELYGHLTDRMARLAKGKLVLALEGGYNLQKTAECARDCMQVSMSESCLFKLIVQLTSVLAICLLRWSGCDVSHAVKGCKKTLKPGQYACVPL